MPFPLSERWERGPRATVPRAPHPCQPVMGLVLLQVFLCGCCLCHRPRQDTQCWRGKNRTFLLQCLYRLGELLGTATARGSSQTACAGGVDWVCLNAKKSKPKQGLLLKLCWG